MSKYPNFITNRLTWISVGLILTFVMMAKASEDGALAEIARSLVMGLSFCALIAYVGEAVAAYRAHIWPNKPLLAALGNCLLFGGLYFGSLFQTVWRYSGFQNYIVTNDYYTFTIMVMAVGIFTLIVLPNFVGSGVPTKTRALYIVLWIFAGGSTAFLTIMSPDLLWLAEWLKPYLISAPRVCTLPP